MRVTRGAILAGFLVAAVPAAAVGIDLGGLNIAERVAYAAPAGANTKLRMTFANTGQSALFIVRLTTPVARAAEFRLNGGAGGVLPLEALSVPADDGLTLGTTTLWVELVGLNRALMPGDGFPATLYFANGGKITVPVTVEPKPKSPLGAALGG